MLLWSVWQKSSSVTTASNHLYGFRTNKQNIWRFVSPTYLSPHEHTHVHCSEKLFAVTPHLLIILIQINSCLNSCNFNFNQPVWNKYKKIWLTMLQGKWRCKINCRALPYLLIHWINDGWLLITDFCTKWEISSFRGLLGSALNWKLSFYRSVECSE